MPPLESRIEIPAWAPLDDQLKTKDRVSVDAADPDDEAHMHIQESKQPSGPPAGSPSDGAAQMDVTRASGRVIALRPELDDLLHSGVVPEESDDAAGLEMDSGIEDLEVRFVPRHAACPNCSGGLIDRAGHCGLCDYDVRELLAESVEYLNLLDTSEDAQPRRLLRALDRARFNGRRLLRVAHGLERGETVRSMGWLLMERGDILNWVIGDVMNDDVQVAREFANQFPLLRWSSDWGAGNQGVTWIAVAPSTLRARWVN